MNRIQSAKQIAFEHAPEHLAGDVSLRELSRKTGKGPSSLSEGMKFVVQVLQKDPRVRSHAP